MIILTILFKFLKGLGILAIFTVVMAVVLYIIGSVMVVVLDLLIMKYLLVEYSISRYIFYPGVVIAIALLIFGIYKIGDDK